MRKSTMQLDRYVLGIALLLIPTALVGQDASEPPSLLKGGLVRQLRSLSEETLQKLKGSDNGNSGARNSPNAAANAPTPRVTSPPMSTSARRSAAIRSGMSTRGNSRGEGTRARSDAGLPQILSAEQVRDTASNASNNRMPPGSERVYVETELPPGVLRTSKVPARQVSQQAADAQAYESVRGEPAGERLTDEPQADTYQPPKVSRVPLPGARVPSARLSDDRPPSAATAPKDQPEKRTIAAELPQGAPLVDEKPTIVQPSPSPQRAMGSVSVPTNLVGGPSIEQTPKHFPPIATTETGVATQGLPELPSDNLAAVPSLGASTSHPPKPSDSPLPATPAFNTAVNPLPATPLTSNRPVTENRLPPTTSNDPKPQVSAPPPNSPAMVERLKMETPRIQVLLNGPADLPLGVPAEYEVLVRNGDNIDLQGLMLRLDIPAGVQVQSLAPSHGEFDVERAPDGVTLLTWAFERLAAGQTATAPMQLIASSPKNFAVAMEWTLMPVSAEANIDVLAPRLELALEGPAEVSYGQPKIYRLHVRNPGNATASQVSVQLSAEPYGSSSTAIGEIAPGHEEVIDVELTFNQQGAINISAEATALGGLASSTDIDVLVRQAKLVANMSAPVIVYHGAEAEYRLRLSNTGDAEATDVEAMVHLPPNAELIGAPPAASLSGNELSWTVAKLAAGSSEEFAVTVKLGAEGENTVQFDCTDASGMSTNCLASTHVESITDLKLLVNDPVAPAPVGGEVTYELTLTNRGSKAATNVKVVAQFSEGIEPIRGVGQAFRAVPGQVFFEPISEIAAGETLKLKVVALAEAEGVHLFRVEVRSDETEVRLVQEESTQYLNAASRIASPMGGAVIR